ncbi:MAG: hypothetical protein LM590_14815, partial [Thermofilum sp.]|nr:hypothetical protein [Thermofilum sp.]
FAHNLLYDYRAAVDRKMLLDSGYNLTFESYDSGRVILKWVKGNRSITFVDTMNYFRTSLEEIGRVFGLPKLQMPSTYESIGEWKLYCMRDVEVLARAVIELLKFMEEELGEFALTAAGFAYRVFMKKFKPARVKFRPPADPRVRRLEEEAYYGGRCEVFRVGRVERVAVLDVNSMYPYVMRNLVVPVRPLAYIQRPPLEKLRDWVSRGVPVIAKVRLSVPCTLKVGPAPYRVRKGGKLLFPTGRFITTLCTPELRLVLDWVEEVFEAVVYKGSRVFTEYVDHYYQKRLEAKQRGDSVRDYFYKLLLNSLYGKFAERRRDQRFVADVKLDADFSIIFAHGKRYKVVDNMLIQVVQRDVDYGKFTAVSAFITSAARAYLYRILTAVPYEKLVYCDTDSIHIADDFDWQSCLKLFIEHAHAQPEAKVEVVRDLQFQILVLRSNLGRLKVEKRGVEGVYLAPKVYRGGGEVKVKGVPKRSADDLRNRYLVERPLGFRESLVRGLGNDRVYWVEEEKILKLSNDKRVYFEDGSSAPICLNTLDDSYETWG